MIQKQVARRNPIDEWKANPEGEDEEPVARENMN